MSVLAPGRPRFVRPWMWTILIGIATLVAFLVLWYPHATPYNNYVWLADGLWHHHVWVDPPGNYIDALEFQGHKYIIEGPLPAILLIPAAAIWGMQTNQTLLSFVFGAVATAAAWSLARRVGVPWFSSLILTLFMALGTDLFFCAVFADVWFLAHVAAACFTLLALLELAGKKRSWLVMLWAVCAFESRFSLILAIPVYAYILFDGAERKRKAISIASVLVPVAVLWLAYNYARWGVWYDIGYTAWYHQDQVGQPTGSPFRLEYLPMQLWAFFVQPPDIVHGRPWLAPSRIGTALTFTSPALILAFFNWRPLRLVIPLWIATIVVAAPNFLYYVVGFVQFGMRHALDFEPFLFMLMCLFAARAGLRWYGIVLCVYSALTGIWGTWYWLAYYRTDG